MAGDWIPMRLDLCDDPAVLEMADILDKPEEYVVGCLHKIWSWASRNCHDGTVTGVTKMSLSRAVKLPEAVSAMLAVGWLVEGKGADGRPFVGFPKWENWLSKSAKARINNAMNQRKSRKTKEIEAVQAQQARLGLVTTLSPPNSDTTVTTVQEITEQKSILENPLNPPKGGEVTDPSKVDPKPNTAENPAAPPAGSDPTKPAKTPRKPKETVGEFLVPQRLDSLEVREALEAFERMRRNIGRPIRDRGNVCRGWDQAYRDRDHLLACINLTTANEWQGIKPSHIDLRSQPAVDPKRRRLEVRPERIFR
jgi:hypothetical protein